MNGGDKVLKWVPVAVLAAGVVGSAYVGNYRLNAQEKEMEDLSESVDENEEELDLLQRHIIQRLGDTKLEIQEIRGDQKLILRLLQEQRNNE